MIELGPVSSVLPISPPRSLRCGPHFPRLLHNHHHKTATAPLSSPLLSLSLSLSLSSSRHSHTTSVRLRPQNRIKASNRGRSQGPASLHHTRDGDAAASARGLHKKDLALPPSRRPREQLNFVRPSPAPASRLATACGRRRLIVSARGELPP